MSSENSLVARKLENYFEVKNSPPKAPEKLPKGVLTELLIVGLMTIACSLTKTTLYLTRLIKRLEA